MEVNKFKITKESIKRILLVIVGTIILGLGAGLFLVPYDIVSGGVSGIGIIFNGLIPALNTEVYVLIFTWLFFFVGWGLLGTSFAAKTIVSTIIYPLAVWLGSYLNHNTPLNLGLDAATIDSTNKFLAALIGGAFVGTGVGLTFIGGGSTGGVDVISLTFQKYFNFKTSVVSFFTDAVIILLGFIFGGDFFSVLIGIISALIASVMIDKLFDSERNVIVDIISKKYNELNDIIINKLDRGCTLIQGIGGYTKEEITILRVALDMREYSILMDIIAQIDPTSFVTVSKASTIRGEGFKEHRVQNLVGKKNHDKEK